MAISPSLSVHSLQGAPAGGLAVGAFQSCWLPTRASLALISSSMQFYCFLLTKLGVCSVRMKTRTFWQEAKPNQAPRAYAWPPKGPSLENPICKHFSNAIHGDAAASDFVLAASGVDAREHEISSTSDPQPRCGCHLEWYPLIASICHYHPLNHAPTIDPPGVVYHCS